MAQTQSNQAQDNGSTADRILEAARRCFSQFGFHKTAMEDIAREAGISRGSIYRHFPDKEALFRAVSEQQAGQFLDAVARRTAEMTGLSAQIEEVVRMTVSFLEDNPLNAAMARTDPESFARILTTDGRDLLAMSIEVVVPLVEAAVERGEVRPDLDVRRAAEWITRISFSLVSTPSVTFDRDDPAQVQAFIREFLVPGLR
ncbi:MAG: TetR/AcrR family transcriptional regulator [Acidimicrobiia bacterium]|nr:TetR/AcrR family transcriptional regulator [Acidimicrobiia bacterium]